VRSPRKIGKFRELKELAKVEHQPERDARRTIGQRAW